MQCALQPSGGACPLPRKCKFHLFLEHVQLHGYSNDDLKLHEVRKQLSVYPPNMRSIAKSKSAIVSLKPANSIVVMQRNHSLSVDFVAHQRVCRFLRLLDHLGTAPWASMHFKINYKIILRLAASHLPLIAPGGSQNLCHIIDYQSKLEGAQNLVWVTNRQQGKTTTLARFVAALAIACPVGGLLFTVYSTSLDRSVELLKASKKYLYWMETEEGRSSEFSLTIERDNERMFCVNNGTASNEVIARPKNPDSCRGDAPLAAIFDEVGFITKAFWEQFAYPLLQVGNRIFTCATTPPHPNSFFSMFIEQVREQNSKNDNFFVLINHSLTCASCLENGQATECCHNLHFLPPWKNLITLNQMAQLATNKDTYQMEVYGIISGQGREYLPKRLVVAAKLRQRVTELFAYDHVWIGIDPASHGVSDFAGVAFALNATGVHVVLGLFNVNMSRCQTTEVQYVVHQFLQRIREHPLVPKAALFVPIIECNNNEILSMSILRVFEQYGPVWIPFEKERFEQGISPGIGVWATHANKCAAVQCTYQAFLDGRVCFADQIVVADRTAFVQRSHEVQSEDMVDLLVKQLCAVQDQNDGTLSAKHAGNDDLSSAFLLAVYWCLCVRASWEAEE